jgi:hypothetical protein
MYGQTDDGDCYGVGLEFEIDGIRHTMTGCKGTVTLADGDPATLQWNFQCDDWVEEIEDCPVSAATAYTTAAPALMTDRIVLIDAARASIGGFTASTNTEVAPRNVQGAYGINGRSGFQVVDAGKAGGSFRELIGSSSEITAAWRYLARSSFSIAVIMGSHGNAVAVRAPVARLIEHPKATDDGGLVAYPEVFAAQDAGTALSHTTVYKVPDFAIHIA